jgi:hypothetical protein
MVLEGMDRSDNMIHTSTCALTYNGDIIRITTKSSDTLLNPL